MGRKVNDLTGMRFGRLRVIKKAGKHKNGWIIWECVCDCGNVTCIPSTTLKQGRTKSCGCIRSETHARHGQSRTKIYAVWKMMRNRTSNPKAINYKDYGGRGIHLCKEWTDFANFYEWAIKNGYKDGLTIERKNNEKGYSPDNCEWTTRKEQNNNRRSSRRITYKGKTKTVTEWETQLGMSRHTLQERLYRGWSVEKAIETPVRKHKKYKKRNKKERTS